MWEAAIAECWFDGKRMVAVAACRRLFASDEIEERNLRRED
jgi:hypothetical protein